jgi:hypothetical protein
MMKMREIIELIASEDRKYMCDCRLCEIMIFEEEEEEEEEEESRE